MFAEGMFCAGGDGFGPCHGDSGEEKHVHCSQYLIFSYFSGGGYFVKYHGLWALRGVVSSGSSKNDGGCDVGRYSLFTNVLDYTSWIDDTIKKNTPMSLLTASENL